MDYTFRQKAIRRSLAKHELNAMVVSQPANIRYLCGFTGSAGVLLVTEHRNVFFTDGRYIEQADAEVKGARIEIARENLLGAAGKWLVPRGRSIRKKINVGIEDEFVTVAGRARLKNCLSKDFNIRGSKGLVEQLRLTKDADEVALVREAAKLGEKLWQKIRGIIKAGVRESEVAAELEFASRRAGAQGMSFETIIAGGRRSALPHGVASSAVIPARGFVVCDFGVILSGYCSDMTRTVSMGQASKEHRRVYAAVRRAQEAAVESVKPGATVGEVDLAARDSLRSEGLAKYFTHSTGHGVGLEIHEAPRIAASGDAILNPGMVVTIEPGVYIPGKFGIRIEDMVLVTTRGHEVLTPSSKELVSL